MPQLHSCSIERYEPSFLVVPTSNQQVEERDKNAKLKMKENADKRRAKDSDLNIGDTVLVRQRKQNKFSTRFDPNPFQVVRKKDTMITAYRNGKYITRNISQFKVIDSAFQESDQEDEDEENLTRTIVL